MSRLSEAEHKARIAARKALCTQMRKYQFQQPDFCNGESVVCGWCDHTVHEMVEASRLALAREKGESSDAP